MPFELDVFLNFVITWGFRSGFIPVYFTYYPPAEYTGLVQKTKDGRFSVSSKATFSKFRGMFKIEELGSDFQFLFEFFV